MSTAVLAARERALTTKVQVIDLPNGDRTWTVIGRDYLPVPFVEKYLEALRFTRSPNTVKAYARGLADWLIFLDISDLNWSTVSPTDCRDFLRWLETGDVAGVSYMDAYRQGFEGAQFSQQTVDRKSVV